MTGSSLGRALVAAVLGLCVTLFVGGCDEGIDGTYQDSTGAFQVDLKGGKAKLTFGPIGSVDTTYTVTKEKVTVKEPTKGDGDWVFTRNSDGSLTADVLGQQTKLTKQKK